MKSAAHSRDWTELTRDCLLNIFSLLSLKERMIGPMLVCKAWKNSCQDPALNLILDLETEFSSPTESSSWWNSEFEDKVDSVLISVVDWSQGNLKKIRIRHCTDRSISYAAERCPNLEVLWVKYCPKVTHESMMKIASNCRKLKELDISYSYEVSCVCMEQIGRNCENLTILKRNLLHHLSDVPIPYRNRCYACGNSDSLTIGRYMPNLTHLELRFSTLTAKALSFLCKKCPNLEYLDIFGCKSLTSIEIAARTSTLKKIKEIKTGSFDV